MTPIIVAIDGPSSCGKSTLARDLAKRLGYCYADTGAMYRAATLHCMEHGLIVNGSPDAPGLRAALSGLHIEVSYDAAAGVQHIFLNGVNVDARIREMDVSRHVSAVSAVPELREKMVALQRRLGEGRGLVMDGRDIGSVVFPQAERKIFLTAGLDERARRRHRELTDAGMQITLKEVRKNLADRDEVDSTRAAAPLVKAPDARVLDNTRLSREEQLEVVMQWIKD